MHTTWLYEAIGYVASILVAISLMMSSILKLRVINLLGAAAFTAYGLLIGAYPVAAVNFIIVLIDLYYLYQIYTEKDEYFTLLQVDPHSDYLRYFLHFYADDIRRFLPAFTYDPEEVGVAFFVLRDMVPAGLFVGEDREAGALCVDLDFVIPGYRDFKIGDYIYAQKADFFRERGIRRIYSRPGSEIHAEYLRRMGFQPVHADEGETLYQRSL